MGWLERMYEDWDEGEKREGSNIRWPTVRVATRFHWSELGNARGLDGRMSAYLRASCNCSYSDSGIGSCGRGFTDAPAYGISYLCTVRCSFPESIPFIHFLACASH
jgi:hypothetical protein